MDSGSLNQIYYFWLTYTLLGRTQVRSLFLEIYMGLVFKVPLQPLVQESLFQKFILSITGCF